MKRLLFAVIFLCLQGCQSDVSELETWISQQPKKFSQFVGVFPTIAPLEIFEYPQIPEFGNPFSLSNLQGPLGAQSLVAEESRSRELLEAFPIEQISWVGVVSYGGGVHALLKVAKVVYLAQVGSYIGQNLGKIVEIGDDELVYRELVESDQGGWVERLKTLELLK